MQETNVWHACILVHVNSYETILMLSILCFHKSILIYIIYPQGQFIIFNNATCFDQYDHLQARVYVLLSYLVHSEQYDVGKNDHKTDIL